MAGVKGRSGRKPLCVEMVKFRAVNKAWELIQKKLDSDDPDRFDKARDIIIKDMASKLEARVKDMDKDDKSIVDKYLSINRIAHIAHDTHNTTDMT